jgi:exportin-T
MASVLDELLSPLMTHISQFMVKSAEDTDDELVRADVLKAYLGLLNSIMASKLTDVFISQSDSTFLLAM